MNDRDNNITYLLEFQYRVAIDKFSNIEKSKELRDTFEIESKIILNLFSKNSFSISLSILEDPALAFVIRLHNGLFVYIETFIDTPNDTYIQISKNYKNIYEVNNSLFKEIDNIKNIINNETNK